MDATLCKAALAHTENMAKQGKMEHKLDGKLVKDRVLVAGYEYRYVGENLAESPGKPDDPAPKPAKIHQGWMDSASHRAAILNPKFTQVGLAVVKARNGTFYYTQVFAAPLEVVEDTCRVVRLGRKLGQQ